MGYIAITKRQIRVAIFTVIMAMVMFGLAGLGEYLRPDCCADLDPIHYQRGMFVDRDISCLLFNKADFDSRMLVKIGLVAIFILVGVLVSRPDNNEKEEDKE